jgi:hypothetical protein
MALDKLMASLGLVNPETLSTCGAKDASLVARNLAMVVDKLTPKEAGDQSRVQLVIYAPQRKTEKHYETIDVHAIGE